MSMVLLIVGIVVLMVVVAIGIIVVASMRDHDRRRNDE
jgi:hypothetical protein